MKTPRFSINVIWHHWDCGDGCCSDSGFMLEAYDSEKKLALYPFEDWDYNRSWGWKFDEYIKQIREDLKREPIQNEDYYLSFWHEDSRGSKWDGYYKGDFEHWK